MNYRSKTSFEVIDTEEKYNLAKQLILVNKELKVRSGITKDFFKISTNFFQQKFWHDGVLPFFSNYGIKKLWADADENEKDIILQKLVYHIIIRNSTIFLHINKVGFRIIHCHI